MEAEKQIIYELDMAQLSQELKFVTYHDGEIALVDRIVKRETSSSPASSSLCRSYLYTRKL